MEEGRKSQYNGGVGEVNALMEVMEQIKSITKEMLNSSRLRDFYRVEFSLGGIRYSIITSNPTRLPNMVFSAINGHFDSERGIENRVE